jgi:glycosyltransferase involved in cell wall biosynthesis
VKKKTFKIALVHDFLREYGGAERVLEALHEMFPQAPVYVAFLDKKALGPYWVRFKDWQIKQTWFAKIPFHKKLYSPLRILAPKAFSRLDLSNYDLIISSSNAFEAKAVKTQHKNQMHICYCHTPPRALYGYSTMSAWKKNFLIKFFGQLINHYMRIIDFKHAQDVDKFIANSQETQQRIRKFYRRDSIVIYPPVSLPLSSEQLLKIKQESPQDYYFYIGRLGLQKHPELAVQACLKLGVKLKVAGIGQMLPQLKVIAHNNKNIEFLETVSDDQLARLFAGAKALLYPVEDEDFGIVPIEAMMAGTPVIAHRSGALKFTVEEKVNGLFFEQLTITDLVKAIKEFENIGFSPKKIQQIAGQYSKEKFKQSFQELIQGQEISKKA